MCVYILWTKLSYSHGSFRIRSKSSLKTCWFGSFKGGPIEDDFTGRIRLSLWLNRFFQKNKVGLFGQRSKTRWRWAVMVVNLEDDDLFEGQNNIPVGVGERQWRLSPRCSFWRTRVGFCWDLWWFLKNTCGFWKIFVMC